MPANPTTPHASWDPRIFLYRGLLSEQECDHLVEASQVRLTRSGVVDTEKGGSESFRCGVGGGVQV